MCREALETPGLSRATDRDPRGSDGLDLPSAAAGSTTPIGGSAVRSRTIDDPVARAQPADEPRPHRHAASRPRSGGGGHGRRGGSIYAAHGMPIDEAEARHNLGYIDLLRGDLVAHCKEMTTARVTLAEVSKASAAIGDVDRAEVLREAGLTREAEALLAGAAAAFGRTRMPQGAGRGGVQPGAVAAHPRSRCAPGASRGSRRAGSARSATRRGRCAPRRLRLPSGAQPAVR